MTERPSQHEALTNHYADSTTTKRAQARAEARRAYGAVLNADVRRDAEILRDHPDYLAENPVRQTAARRYLASGLMDDPTDNNSTDTEGDAR